MKKYSNHIKFLILLALVVFLYGFSSHRNAAKKYNGIKVNFKAGENLFISYKTVNKLLIQKLKLVEKEGKENINLKLVEQFVQNNKMIETAEIFKEINGEIGAIITQRIPVLRVSNGLDSYYYDDKGKKMPLSSNFSARVPITTSDLDAENCDDIIRLANKIKNDAFLQKQIIGINQIEGFNPNQFELKTRIGNQTVIFGDLKKMDSKMNNLKVFYQKVMADGTINNYKTINLKFNNQVVCAK